MLHVTNIIIPKLDEETCDCLLIIQSLKKEEKMSLFIHPKSKTNEMKKDVLSVHILVILSLGLLCEAHNQLATLSKIALNNSLYVSIFHVFKSNRLSFLSLKRFFM